MSRTFRILVASAVAVSACAERQPTLTAPDAAPRAARSPTTSDPAAGGVYTMTNGASANAVLAFRRAANGALTPLGAFPTGGRGTGGTVDPLQSQYSVLLDESHAFLFVVDAGSDEVSVFRIGADGTPTLVDRAASGGDRPVSLALSDRFLFVLNAGDNTVSGLRVNPNGKLIAVPGSTRALAPGAAGASTIHFTPDGEWLVVTERDANRLETMRVAPNGRPGAPVVTMSSGAVPFGFDVTAQGYPVVTEAMGAPPNGAVSSYRFGAGGALLPITASLNAGGRATCWLVLTADDRYAFAANSASDAIAALAVGANGAVTLLNAFAGMTATGSIPLDLDLSDGDGFLYTLDGGSGHVSAFAVGANASLAPIGDVVAGSPASGLQGMAAW